MITIVDLEPEYSIEIETPTGEQMPLPPAPVPEVALLPGSYFG